MSDNSTRWSGHPDYVERLRLEIENAKLRAALEGYIMEGNDCAIKCNYKCGCDVEMDSALANEQDK